VADSLFKTLATEVNTKLAEILTAEGRTVPEFSYAARKQFTEQERAVRVAWAHAGGRFVFETQNNPSAEPGAPPPPPPIGARVARAIIRIWHSTDEEAEHVLDRIWMATQRVDSQTNFRWAEASYEYPTESGGEDQKNGVSVIRLELPIDMPVPSEYDGETEQVEIARLAFRVGIENPAGEDPEDSEYDVIRAPEDWT
jgi:hypothetical protein